MRFDDPILRAPLPSDYGEEAIRAPQPGESGWNPVAELRAILLRSLNPEQELSNETIFPRRQNVNPLQPLTPTLTNLVEGVPVQDRSQILPEILGFMPGAGAARGTAPVRTELTELLPVIAHSLKQRRALAQAVPEYSGVVEGLGGVTENAGRMIREGAGNLWNRIKGVVPEAEILGDLVPAPALEGLTSAAEYRPFLHKLLGKHAVIAPYIPRSVEEPLILKTTAPNVKDLYQAVTGTASKSENPIGMYMPLWKKAGGKGDIVLSTTKNQERTLPHEFGHFVDDLLTEYFSSGKRPLPQVERAAQKFDPAGATYPLPGRDYEAAAADFWSRLGDEPKSLMRRIWGRYGNRDSLMQRELMSELVNPESLAQTLRKSDEAAWNLRTKAGLRWPELKRFWEMVPDYIPDEAYHIPQWSIPQAGAGLPSAAMPAFGGR